MPRQKRAQAALHVPPNGEADAQECAGKASRSPQPNSPAHKKRRALSTHTANRSISTPVGSSGSFPGIGPSPLLSGAGDVIVAHNPFDDAPMTAAAAAAAQSLGTPLLSVSVQQGYPIVQSPMSVMMQHKPLSTSSGKVYPPNQPMIFNPQNPNAPPIYPCGICHKEVHDNDQAILCESGCNFWFHRVCTGLTEGAYYMLTAEVYAEWVCDKCLATKDIPLVKVKP
ncbi:PREDICTED: protein pygopus-like [Priapulus caudatus]|uniref:Protein pygopus-like n=1 Tax=Priapulus caudatus TaxID=37621 RepID=A0ABM1DRY3_PRICU|nr:PREDICTED: protein pygopus-like [Priapulus caudatus]